MDQKIPFLLPHEIEGCLELANSSPKNRYPMILHSPGDEFNSVFNFMKQSSYMQPHLHPAKDKIENIYLVHGLIAVLFFDEHGKNTKCTMLNKPRIDFIEVPAFTWHTYIILSDYAITYETMMGVYNPDTWKHLASWAPIEGGQESLSYLEILRLHALAQIKP
jgi:cupin fold WbuC family metalloprotein